MLSDLGGVPLLTEPSHYALTLTCHSSWNLSLCRGATHIQGEPFLLYSTSLTESFQICPEVCFTKDSKSGQFNVNINTS